MKILLFTTLYPNAEQTHHGIFIEKRLLELRKRYELDVEVVAPVPWFPFNYHWAGSYRKYSRIAKSETRSGVLIHHPRYLVIPILGWRFAPISLFIFSLITIRRVRKSGFRFQLLDAHFMFPDGVAAQMLGAVLNVPVCITARGSDIYDSLQYSIPRKLIKWAISRAQFVVAVSQDLARNLLQLGGDGIDVEVLPNGVDNTVFYPRDRSLVRTELGLKKRVVLSVGNLRRLKGHDILIRAMENIDDATLLIIGVGEELENLKQITESYGNKIEVRFLGDIPNDDLPAYYSTADVFALASSSEGCPNVVLEAIACGTPVVATAVGAIPELLPASCHEFLVRERNVAGFSSAIKRCLENPPDQATILARAKELGWDHTCERLFTKMMQVT